MPAALDMSTGKAAMFSAKGILPWHGLGTVIKEEGADSERAMELAHLDYELIKLPVQSEFNGEIITSDNNFSVVRTDTKDIIGVVGRQYNIVQNKEAFKFFDDVIGEKLACYETAGALFNGSKVWILAKLPRDLFVKGTDDVTKTYVLLATTHDGSSSVHMFPTTVRVVCANTVALAMKQKTASNSISVRHTANVKDRLEKAKQRLQKINASLDVYQEQMDYLASQTVTISQVEKYIEELFPLNPNATSNTRTENIRQAVLNNYELDEGIKLIRGTAWSAFNAVTRYVDHDRSSKGTSDLIRRENKMESVLFGSGASIKNQALQLALSI